MENSKRKIYFQSEGTKNYLVVDLAENERLIPYCCTLLKNNDVPGLLTMHYQMLDGMTTVKYDISGKVRLGDYMTQRHVSYQTGLMLLKNLCDTFRNLPQYFLTIDQCLLDPESVFVGDGLHTFFPCLPLEENGGERYETSLQLFFAELLSRYFATESRTDFDEMFKWVHRSSLFDLEAFSQRFLQDTAKSAPPAAAPAAAREPAPWQAPAPKPAPAPVPPRPVQPAPAPMPPRPVQPAPAPEKKEPKRFGGFGKASAPAPAPVPIPASVPIPGQAPQAPKPAQPAPGAVLSIPGGGSLAIPGAAPGGAAPAPKPEKEAKAAKGGIWPFGKHKGKEKPAENEPAAPVPVPGKKPGNPVPPLQPAPAPYEPAPAKPVRAAVRQEWEEGTIWVGEGGGETEIGEDIGAGGPAAQGAWLEHNGKRVPITADPFLVGKANSVYQLHYAISNNNKVSRNHVTIFRQDGRYMLRDNQSRNGTFLNNKALVPLEAYPLSDGDEIRLYNEVLIFHLG